jgi:hypothetical protein
MLYVTISLTELGFNWLNHFVSGFRLSVRGYTWLVSFATLTCLYWGHLGHEKNSKQ